MSDRWFDDSSQRTERHRHRLLPAIFVGVTAVGLISDQAGKGWAFASGGPSARSREVIPGLSADVQARNYGAILSQEGSGTALIRNGLAVIGIVALGIVLRWAVVLDRDCWHLMDALAGGLLLGGALGNQLDRLTLGYVRDHLTLWLWPHEVFNMGDVFMVAGALLLLGSLMMKRRPVSIPRPMTPVKHEAKVDRTPDGDTPTELELATS